ncbi:MAG TPA: DNA gyrase subunit A [Mollicutes bacterium]|nr:DNA gyrase subunit A [Mollicutes bacterium]
MDEKLKDINISDEMEGSFLDYSMSVIVARALPDVRDGLKPVHRRILYTMYEEGFLPDKKYVKSANTVGNVLAHYHPHGDTAVYDTMVRMAQPFNYRYPLVDGHGNFGSIDGYSAAAQRYTESKLAKISMEMLRDINKETVDFGRNYDGERKEPSVLPSRFPNILVNGTMGIAVGMATNIPPHNLCEVIDGCVAYIENNDITVLELMEHIKGPDFPTGANILGNSGIKKAYETGKGIITIRATCEIVEQKNGKQSIIVTEIPYQVNKSSLIAKIAELAREKIIEGITDLRDETDLKGIRIVIDLRKDANANVILNNLYKYTNLQISYGINLLALVDGEPKLLGLKTIIEKYIEHQRTVIIRRTKFDLDKASKRAHILDGLVIALDNIDDVIQIIKSAKNDNDAIEQLINKYNLTKEQSEAILEMKLRRLTGLERDKIESELKELKVLIESLKEILASEEKILNIIKEELLEIKTKYGDERRTNIDVTSIEHIEDESLIPVEDIVITLTNKGYIKRINNETYRTQNRGGVGIKGMTINEEDIVEHLLLMKTHDHVMFFTNKGKVYRIKGYTIPIFSRQSKGLPIINLLPLEPDEKVNVLLKVNEEDIDSNIVFCTQKGLVKRTKISEFENIRVTGKIAITLKDDDELIAVKKTTGDNEIMIASADGRMIRFNENEVRIMGRTASGVRGINIGENGKCVGCEIATEDQMVLIVTENGYGKKTDINEYRTTHRGTKGVKALNITEKNGNIVSFKLVDGNEDLMIITDFGIIIKLSLEQVSTTGRVAQGVRLINLKDDQKVGSIAIDNSDEKAEENEDVEEKDE